MNDELPNFSTFCPLFNFEVSEVLVTTTSNGILFEKHKEVEHEFEILNDVKIRKISKEELEEIKRFGESIHYPSINEQTFLIESLKCTDKTMTQFEEVLSALRLYKSGGVFIRVLCEYRNGKISSFGILDSPIPKFLPVPYVLETEEIEDIKKLANKLDNVDFDKRTSFRIACERFNRSYEENRPDAQIIDLMVSFEALFLRSKKSIQKIGTYIGLGCSMLLGKDDGEREKIGNFLVEAYKVRNRIVHGSELETPIKINGKIWQIEGLVSQLREYLRESIKKLL